MKTYSDHPAASLTGTFAGNSDFALYRLHDLKLQRQKDFTTSRSIILSMKRDIVSAIDLSVSGTLSRFLSLELSR